MRWQRSPSHTCIFSYSSCEPSKHFLGNAPSKVRETELPHVLTFPSGHIIAFLSACCALCCLGVLL